MRFLINVTSKEYLALKYIKKLKGLNMLLVLINISTYIFSPSKKFVQLLVPINISTYLFTSNIKRFHKVI